MHVVFVDQIVYLVDSQCKVVSVFEFRRHGSLQLDVDEHLPCEQLEDLFQRRQSLALACVQTLQSLQSPFVNIIIWVSIVFEVAVVATMGNNQLFIFSVPDLKFRSGILHLAQCPPDCFREIS